MPRVSTTLKNNAFTIQPYLIESSFRTANPLRAILKGTGTAEGPSSPSSLQVVFPFGPQNVEYGSYEGKFSEVVRPYRKPILAYENQQLRVVTFNALIADKPSGGTLSIVPYLDNLETMSRLGWRCSFIYGLSSLGFDVAITKLSYTVKYRNTDGSPIRAEVSLQLTEMPFINQEITLLNAVYRQPASETGVVSGGDGGTPGSEITENDQASVDPNLPGSRVNFELEQAGALNEFINSQYAVGAL